MKRQNPNRLDLDNTITRRKFIGTTAGTSAALLSGGLASFLRAASMRMRFSSKRQFRSSKTDGFRPVDQQGVSEGLLAPDQLAESSAAFSHRDQSRCVSNRANISTTNAAEAMCGGRFTGFLVLVKDNIATDDRMETTAGSLALVGSRVPADAPIIQQLRDAGAVILGKANLGEWANFRGTDIAYPLAVGWSARGGSTINPYVPELYIVGIQFRFGQWRWPPIFVRQLSARRQTDQSQAHRPLKTSLV